MAKQIINVGTSANSGTGDTLRDAMTKVNQNFDEVYLHAGDTSNPHGVTAAQVGAIALTEKGAADGVAALDASGKLLAAQKPSYAYSEITGKPVLADVATSGDYADLSGTPVLAGVATSGAFSDLTGKPVGITYSGTTNKLTISDTDVTIKGDLVPDADVVYSLGAPNRRWKDIYVSANTIHVGDTTTLSGAKIEIDPASNPTKLDEMPTMIAARIVAKPFTYNPGGGNVTVRPSIEFQDQNGTSYPISFNTETFEFSFDAQGNYGTGSLVAKKLTLSNDSGTGLALTGRFSHVGDYLNTQSDKTFRFDGNMTLGYDAARALTVKASATFEGPVTFSGSTLIGDGNDNITINAGAANDLLVSSKTLTVTSTGTTVGGNLIVSGNLTIKGATTTIESNTLSIGDNIIVLNNDVTGDIEPTENAGIQVSRGTKAAVQWLWDETNDIWGPMGADMGNIGTLTATTLKGNLQGNVTGNVTGNAGTATKLATARTINGVSFDGSANISFDTGSVTEGSNLYFTQTRARTSISATGGLTYSSSTGVIDGSDKLDTSGGTLTGFVYTTVATVAGAGTTQATAAALTASMNVVSGAANSGVRLPAAQPGMTVYVVNSGAAAVKVYPASSAQIDGNGANVALTLGAGAKLQFIATATNQWYAMTAVYA